MTTTLDPRAENCRALGTDAQGRVTGVLLQVRPLETGRYALRRVELIDEVAAQGNTVATCTVLDADGLTIAERVYLAWAWPTPTEHALPGNPNGQHPITNGYTPPNVGPLALYVGDANGNPISDMVGGLGLPWNRHVSYRATWQARRTEPDTPDADEDAELYRREVAAFESMGTALEDLAGIMGRLAKHLGA